MSNLVVRAMFWLAACVAARRFVQRRHGSGQHSLWPRILLCWRRKPKGATDLRTASKARIGGTFWCPQFHLHLKMILHRRVLGRETLQGFYQTATIRESQRILPAYQWKILHRQFYRVGPPSKPQSLHLFHGTAPSWRPEHGSMPISFRTRTLAIAGAESGGSRIVPGTQGRILRRTARRAWVERVAVSKLWVSGQESVLKRAMLRREFVSQQMNSKAIDHTKIKSDSECVWSHRSQSSVRIPDPRMHQEVPLLFRRQSNSATKQEQIVVSSPGSRSAALPQASTAHPNLSTQAIELPSRVRGTESAQAMTIDPVLLNRLTDDVIRRVEQRVRIDRERRGL